jgi:thiamine biosynthesis lipoprotein
MGTRLSIEIPAPVREEVFEAAFDEVARLEMVMSNWDESSEISRLNRAAAAPFRCSPDLFAAVAAALGWAERTGGAFDPTVEPLVRDLGLRGPEGRLPGAVGPGVAASASRAGRHPAAPIGWRHVRLSQGDRTVRFDAPGVGVDLGGIGKGIALDAAAAVLARSGVNAALLDFGGQVLALGPPPGRRGWTVGIADPADRERAVGAVVLRDASLASSGNGERGTGAAGAGHILDPLRRAPARFGGTVTVRAADAASADALSTALFVMGPEEGRAWAGAHGIAALYLWRRPDGGLERRETGPLGDERN